MVIWLVVLGFRSQWANGNPGSYEALAVVKRFDVIKDCLASLGSGFEVAAIDQFLFEGAPEGFHGGIVVAVAFAAHGGDRPA